MTQPAGYGQPSHPYYGQYRPEVQAEPEPIGLSNWDGSLTARAALEPSPIAPPTIGKNLSPLHTGNTMLTDDEQSRLSAGGITRAGPPSAHSIQ